MKKKMIKDVVVDKELFGMKQMNAIILLIGVVAGFTLFNNFFDNVLGIGLSFYNVYFLYFWMKKDSIFKHQYQYEVALRILEVKRVKNKK